MTGKPKVLGHQENAEEPRDSALCLSETEWRDIGPIARCYIDATTWAEREQGEPTRIVRRRRQLAQRIMEASH